jgi:hypothetical protein
MGINGAGHHIIGGMDLAALPLFYAMPGSCYTYMSL